MAIAPLSAPQVASVDTPAEAPSAASDGVLAQAKAPTSMGKGPILGSLPVASAATGISPELLQNMQQMIAEREARKGSFMESLKDANAWWSGGMAGPGEALRARTQEREGQDATTFGMKSALAQYKAAQAAAQNQLTSLKGLTGGQAGAPAAGGAPGVQATGKPMPIAVQQEFDRLLSLNPPDIAGAKAIREAWVKDQAKFNPDAKTQKQYFINKKAIDLTPEEYDLYKLTGKLPGETTSNQPAVVAPGTVPTEAPTTTPGGVNVNNVGNVRPVGATTGFQQPKDMNEGLQIMDNNLKAYADKGINTLSGIIGRWSPPNENDTPALIAAASKRLGIDPNQKIDLTNPAVRQAVGTAIMLQEKGKSLFVTPGETAPLSKQRAEVNAAKPSAPTSSELPYPNPANLAEVKANETYIADRAKKELEISVKGPEAAGTEAGKRQAQIFKLAEDAEPTIKAADQVIAASKNYPEAVGLGKGMTASNVLTTVAGAVVPKMTKEKAEDQYADLALGKEASVARSQVNTASKQLGISFAADVFKGARMGIGLENMAANAKGVSEHNRPENNIVNATLIKEAAIFNKKRAELFKNEWAPKNGGKMADFEKFEASPEYEALKEETQKRISDSLPDYLKLKDGELVEKNPGKSGSKFDKFKNKKG